MNFADIKKWGLARLSAAQKSHAGVATVNSSGQVCGPSGAPVSGGGAGVKGATLLQRAVLCAIPGRATPTYLGTELGNGGDYGRGLVEYSGDLSAPTFRTVVNAKTLTPVGGGTALGNNIAIHNVWVLADGSALIHVFEGTSSLSYLYLTNTTRTSVGSDAGRSNGQAVMNIGSRLGTQYANIRVLGQRGLCEAVSLSGVRTLYFAEYNVSAGRTAGSANDFVRVLQSSDGGLTWTTFMEFNMGAQGLPHYLDHFHGVTYNPYTSQLYFMTGDDSSTGNDERAIILWDGASSAPALNSSLATFAATPGWRVLRGTELYRTCDILFYPQRAYWLCDCDTEAIDTTSVGFSAMLADPALSYASRAQTIERLDNIPPILACKASNGVSVWASFHNASPSENRYHIWTSGDKGDSWALSAKFVGYAANTVVATPSSLFADPYVAGRVIFGGVFARGVQWTAAATSGYSYILDVDYGTYAQATYG